MGSDPPSRPWSHILWLDTETFCETPIKHGTHRYAENAEIMICAWALDDGPIIVEDYTPGGTHDGPSPELRRWLSDPDTLIVMHNSAFDRTVVRRAWAEYQVQIPVERVHDTMVRALAHGLPGSLDKLCEIFGVAAEDAKQSDGKDLIQLFCVPRPKNMKLRRATRASHPAQWNRFLSYAGSDIRSMRVLYAKLPKWNYTGRELVLWGLDQRINDRGFNADLALASNALVAVRQEQRRLKDEAWFLSGGEIVSPTKGRQVLEYLLAEHGVDLPDLKKDTLERRLADERLPEPVKELIRVRLAASTASTAKLGALLRAVSDDGRLRGSLQFCGAARTGRWGGRLFQPQNLPRPDADNDEINLLVEGFLAGSIDLITDDVMSAASNILRGLIIAGEGRQLAAADLSNIEGRVAAWLAGEQWKLDAFAEIDADPSQPDMYKRAYGASFGVDPASVTKDQRQVGKVQELALGYEGGVGAFLAFAAVYRLDLEAMAAKAYGGLPDAARAEAERMLSWRKQKRLSLFGLSEQAFIVCETFKILWRRAHPAISTYWKELEDAARWAIQNPGREIAARRIRFRRDKAWLRMILPSGRSLCYPAPEVSAEGKISYLGTNQYTRKWQRLSTYGGKLFENACQAVARDVMAHAMPEIEAAGYEIILTVHDEVITECPEGWDADEAAEGLSTLLATNPPWLDGCPLAASGFAAKRYRKD